MVSAHAGISCFFFSTKKKILVRFSSSGGFIAAPAPQVVVWKGDITLLAVDAIVNAANAAMLGLPGFLDAEVGRPVTVPFCSVRSRNAPQEIRRSTVLRIFCFTVCLSGLYFVQSRFEISLYELHEFEGFSHMVIKRSVALFISQ